MSTITSPTVFLKKSSGLLAGLLAGTIKGRALSDLFIHYMDAKEQEQNDILAELENSLTKTFELTNRHFKQQNSNDYYLQLGMHLATEIQTKMHDNLQKELMLPYIPVIRYKDSNGEVVKSRWIEVLARSPETPTTPITQEMRSEFLELVIDNKDSILDVSLLNPYYHPNIAVKQFLKCVLKKRSEVVSTLGEKSKLSQLKKNERQALLVHKIFSTIFSMQALTKEEEISISFPAESDKNCKINIEVTKEQKEILKKTTEELGEFLLVFDTYITHDITRDETKTYTLYREIFVNHHKIMQKLTGVETSLTKSLSSLFISD